MKLLGAQLAGVAATGIFVFAVALIAWVLIKAIMGLRVSLQEEIEGLDIGEHGNSAYPEFLTRKPAYSYVGTGDIIPAREASLVNERSLVKEGR